VRQEGRGKCWEGVGNSGERIEGIVRQDGGNCGETWRE
jgi:hypothetical protein